MNKRMSFTIVAVASALLVFVAASQAWADTIIKGPVNVTAGYAKGKVELKQDTANGYFYAWCQVTDFYNSAVTHCRVYDNTTGKVITNDANCTYPGLAGTCSTTTSHVACNGDVIHAHITISEEGNTSSSGNTGDYTCPYRK